MELIFLIFTVAAGAAEGIALLLGYALFQKGRPSPKGLNILKLTLFCVFFGCWFLWNLFRNLS